MRHRILEPGAFISQYISEGFPVIDTRSEDEFTHASIPGSKNLPLLINDHRKRVGTLYKQQGKEAAVLEGFRLAGPRFHAMLEYCLNKFSSRSVFLYCWR